MLHRAALCPVLLWAVMSAGPLLAQDAPDLRINVPAGTRARSDSIALEAGDELQIRLETRPGEPEPHVSVYVHARDGELVGRDDPDVTSEMYSWRAERAGQFYLLVQNSGAGAAVVVATRRPSGVITRGEPRPFAIVRVFFATGRVSAATTPARFFGSEPSGRLAFGYSDVSVPRDHQLGELEGPSIFRLEFSPNPEKHIAILRVQAEDSLQFHRAFSARVAASLRNEALLFIHGFNVDFGEAVRRAAQISYDLAFDGPTVAFSWPSQGKILLSDYRKDERNAELSADDLRRVILDLMRGPRPVTLHVVAHSMGNRVLAAALQQIARESSAPPKLSQVAMIAPDIDAEVFRRAAGRIAATAARVTLYASSGDAALKLSQKLAGYRRAGQGGPDVLIVRGIDTVDASSVDTSALGVGHAYYADNSTILSDLFSLLQGRPPSERFGLASVKTPRGLYWRFHPAVR